MRNLVVQPPLPYFTMWIAFTRPEYLLLLLPTALALWYSARASYAGLRGRRMWAAWAARGLSVLALVSALAGTQLIRSNDSSAVVFLADASFSVAPEERARALKFVQEALRTRRPQDRAALIMFGRDAIVESEVLRAGADLRPQSQPAGTHTNIAGSLRLALGLLPPGSAKRIVLLSDGNENVGSAAHETALLRANHVALDAVALKSRAMTDTLVRDVVVPSEARKDEPIPVRATVESAAPQAATATILVDDAPVERKAVTVAAGTTALEFPVALQQPGFHKVDVLLETKGATAKENDRGTGFVRVRGEPKLLIASERPSDAARLARVLRRQGLAVDSGGPVSVPISAADLERYDSVLLCNLPAYRMTVQQMAMLRDATRDLGVGLGMVGGEYGFGAGGYYQSPLEEALPVSMDVTKDRAFPAATVFVIIDTSGSMGMMEDGVEKIQLAAEAATAVVDLLQPYDSLGVLISDPSPTFLAQPRKVSDKEAMKTDIRSIRAGGGGIYVFPSLSLAYQAMRTQTTPIRHIIMLADGDDCDNPEGTVDLATGMAAEKITTTTIAFGPGKDVGFLQDVARAGHGQFYLTERGQDLKKIFTRETLTVAKSVLIEERFQAQTADSSPLTQGLDWASAPPLLGYVATSRKSLARTPLVTHKADPLLAHWQYGLGRSLAFTSDATAHWAAYWLRWPGYARLWGESVRWTLRQLDSGLLHVRVEREGDRAHVIADAATERGEIVNGLEVRANVDAPDRTREEVALDQTAPGRYEATFDAAAVGSYIIGLSAHGAGGLNAHQTAGFAVAYPPDYADTRSNEGLLTSLVQQTGGRMLTDPASVFEPPAVTPRIPLDISRALLWLVALLLPVDVAIRRLTIGREDTEALTRPLLAVLARLRRRRTRERRVTMSRLLERKQAAKGEREPEPAAPVLPPRAGPAPPQAAEEPSPPDAARPAREPDAAGGAASRLAARRRERRGSADDDSASGDG